MATHIFSIIIPQQDVGSGPYYMNRMAQGDRDAFAWIYTTYFKKVYDYALLITMDKSQSEDIVQEIFLRLWDKREKLQSIDSFNHYLHAMVKNYMANCFRTNNRHQSFLKQYAALTDRHTLQKDSLALEREERLQLLQQAVSRLTAQQKQVYRYQRVEGLPVLQVAQKLEISPYTVKIHINKTRKFLRGYLLNQQK